jgi:hypothetical protein
VGDAYYSKKTFVDGVTCAGFAFVGKLRVDANLKYKYIGPRTAGQTHQLGGKRQPQQRQQVPVIEQCLQPLASLRPFQARIQIQQIQRQPTNQR